MPQVRQMAQTDNTVDEKTSIQRHQAGGTAEAHDSDEMEDHEFTGGLSSTQNVDNGDEQPRPANAVDPGDSEPMHGASTVSRGVIWKGGVRATDTYETPGGAPADDYSADRLGNETGLPGDTPAAGDVDPDSTYVAEETGQDGDPTRPGKSHGKPWSS